MVRGMYITTHVRKHCYLTLNCGFILALVVSLVINVGLQGGKYK